MMVDCPICGAKPLARVEDRPCLCGWTVPQMRAVERLTRERDEWKGIAEHRALVQEELIRELENWRSLAQRCAARVKDLTQPQADATGEP